ncbi:glycosyltransferase [Leptolyngbya sp. FACHB-321]|uniref:glycosyltransferase n=1 Tax=Leptolyngbya sp. FACHB-321 TaxID=2692807 RepID=UPI00168670C6|nr:glycosyltransferase [Leptolyngbya sp. FACHB-321]MBD2037021.1 glycosyltransferase [Leptolyngbya sp. FACHB-321]
MARFLLGTIPVIGHVSPAVPVVRELIKRGHEVCWYTGQAFQTTVEQTGAKFAPIRSWLDYSDLKNVPESVMKQRDGIEGVERLKFDLKNFFIDPAAGQVKDLLDLLYEFPADVLIADSMFLGMAWVAEQKQLPWAEFDSSALALSSCDTAPFGLGLQPSNTLFRWLRNHGLRWFFQQTVLRPLRAYTNNVRSQVGLPPSPVYFFDRMSPFLYLCPCIPEFEYPRSDLPPQVHFIGPLLSQPTAEFTPPHWWDELNGNRPVIHVTQGTIATNLNDLLVPALRALETEDVLVVATTGGAATDTLNLPLLPAHVRIEPFIPHAQLLPHVDVMITNGGYNGVQIALAHGVPLVVAGQTEEKPEIAARVEWAQVGINLRTGTPTPAQIQKAVKTLLVDSSYRTRVKQLQTQMQQYNAPAIAANLIERLAEIKRPVLNT